MTRTVDDGANCLDVCVYFSARRLSWFARGLPLAAGGGVFGIVPVAPSQGGNLCFSVSVFHLPPTLPVRTSAASFSCCASLLSQFLSVLLVGLLCIPLQSASIM